MHRGKMTPGLATVALRKKTMEDVHDPPFAAKYKEPAISLGGKQKVNLHPRDSARRSTSLRGSG